MRARPACLLLLLLAGCGLSQINHADLEGKIRKQVVQRASVGVRSVSCPNGIDQKQGRNFTCRVVVSDGERIGFQVVQTDGAGHLHIAPMQLITSSVQQTISQRLAAKGIRARTACPTGVAVRPGSSVLCTITDAQGKHAHVKVMIRDADGAYDLLVAR